MIYFDNCSTTHKKPRCVIKSASLGLKKFSINSGRGGYKIAVETGLKVLETREKVVKFFNAESIEDVIFTPSCTIALNLAIIGSAKQNGHIITTIFEHNSVLRTLDYVSKIYNITYSLITPNNDGNIELKSIEKEIKENTYMVIINHTSNVTGATQNIKNIGNMCKIRNLKFLVDGAQSCGHEIIDIKKYNINLLAIAGHKGLFAPTGIGILIKNNINLKPIIFGGTGTFSESIIQPNDSPEAFESGTQNILGILGLNAGIDYVNKNFYKNNLKIKKLTKYLLDNLEDIPNISTPSNNINSGVVSVIIKDLNSSEVCDILDKKYGICCRSGLHCAPLVHTYYKTLKTGMTRIGINNFNTKRQIKKLLFALKNISK